MQSIVAPIKPGESSPQVVNLQDGLRLLLERGVFRTFDPPNAPTVDELSKLALRLAAERAQSLYADATQRLVLYFQLQEGLGDDLGGAVEEKTAARLNETLKRLGAFDDAADWVVRGTVRDADGNPLPAIVVLALDRDLNPRRSQPLARPVVTDERGFYEIRYPAKHFARAEAGGPDIQVQAFDSETRERMLGESSIFFNAGNDVTIDLAVQIGAARASEFERYLGRILPLLVGQHDDGRDLAVAELTLPQIDFIASDTGIAQQHIEWLRTAFAYSAKTAQGERLSEWAYAAERVPAPFFYGWFRFGMPTLWEELQTQPVAILRKTLLDGIDQNVIPSALRDYVEDVLLRIPNPRLRELATALEGTALQVDKLRAVLTCADAVDTLSDDVLLQLVDENVLSASEASSIGLNVSLHRLTGGASALVATVLGTEYPDLKAGKVQRASELASLEPRDWERAIEASGMSAPEGTSQAAFARNLALSAARNFPSTAFVQRATRVPPKVADHLGTLRPLLDKNPGAISRDFDALDLDGVDAVEREKLRTAHANLRELANLNPGLDLHEVFAKQRNDAEAAAAVRERLSWMSTVFELNPEVSFLDLDYLPGSAELAAVDFGPLEDEAKTSVVQNLKAHQRVYKVAGNAVAAAQMMRAGFHSATAIAKTPASDFAAKAGIAPEEAHGYRQAALRLAEDAAIRWHAIYEAARDSAVAPVRSIPSQNDFFMPLAGFQELLQNEPWCECAHCQSVLSPAAYFVDLMYYVETGILTDSFRNQETHPLHLQQRRPDLWDLELTCKNTDEKVPYLDLVNEILEGFIRKNAPVAANATVHGFLAAQGGSFRQPFAWPIERLDVFLRHFGRTRYEVVRAMGADRKVQTRARLSLSRKEYELITVPSITTADLPFLKQLYRMTAPANVASPDSIFALLEMQLFLRATALSHDIVEAILKTRFVNADGSANVRIETAIEKRTPDDVQSTVELVKNVSPRRLDRIHRFTRLWRRLGWTVQELDYLLTQLATAEPVSRIDEQVLDSVCDLLELNATWALPLDEVLSLAGISLDLSKTWPLTTAQIVEASDVFPPTGLRGSEDSLFDRLFNSPPFRDRDGPWPPAAMPTLRFSHPAWKKRNDSRGASVPDNNTLTRLLAGLQLEDKELVELIESLVEVPILDYQAATTTRDESIALSKQSIGLLYRHARLMRLLNLPVADFRKLLQLTPRLQGRASAERYLRDSYDVAGVAEFATWSASSGFTVDEILHALDTTGLTRFEGAPDVDAIVVALVAGVAEEKSFDFADTVFTALGLTDLQSREIVAENTTTAALDKAFVKVPDRETYRLRTGADPAVPATMPLTLGAGIAEAAVRILLGAYHFLSILDARLAGALQRSRAEIMALRAVAHPNLDAADVAAITAALQGDPDTTRLSRLVAEIARFRTLFKNKVFDAGSLEFVRGHRSLFGLQNPPAAQVITTDVFRRVATYAALASRADDRFGPTATDPDVETIQAVLANAGGVGAADEDDLAATLRTDAARIAALRPQIQPLPADPFEALEMLERGLTLVDQLGVSGETLELMSSEDLDDLGRAAEDVFGAFRAKYPEEKIFQEKVTPFEDTLRARKRDALVDFFTSKWPVAFDDANKLYEYFLMDVLMGGCARTSRIVAATGSVQLYVHRVLMNLEKSADLLLVGNAVLKGVYARFRDPDKRAEWYWREHYRVWEANRKIFLYPENYIEPELRDDKTPPFEELEATLLQQQIDDSNVEDAYARYLVGFDEAARLSIAGAYYVPGTLADHRDDVLHLFGVTQEAPPVYYYCVARDTRSATPRVSAWHKQSLQVPVRKVSPIFYDNRLYVFWLETTTRPLSKFAGGDSKFEGYRHNVRIRYSILRADGAWTPPQNLRFAEGAAIEDSRLIEDPKTNDEADARKARIAKLEADIVGLKSKADAAERAANDAFEDWRRADQKLADVLWLVKHPGDWAVPWDAAKAFVKLAEVEAYIMGNRFLIVSWIDFKASWLQKNPGYAALLALPGSQGAVASEMAKDAMLIIEANARKARDDASAAAREAQGKRRDAQTEIDKLKNAAPGRVGVRWDRTTRDHTEPQENYKPEGWEWERVYPTTYQPSNASEPEGLRLMLVPRNLPVPIFGDQFPKLITSEVDFPAGILRPLPSTEKLIYENRPAFNKFGPYLQFFRNNTSMSYTGQSYYLATFWLNRVYSVGNYYAVVSMPTSADVQSVNAASDSVTVEFKGDVIWLQKIGTAIGRMTRLSTPLTADLIGHLAHSGVEGLLSWEFQDELDELDPPPAVSVLANQLVMAIPGNPFDPASTYLTYFRETFFHIPFLIANYLNSQRKFEATQRWYHHIFNPMAPDGVAWRYREFRELPKRSLRDLLTWKNSLEAYREDPFNPHAIACTRLSAYQKSIVMKYIDNLLDWGDSLFTQFTMESVGEATMLYVLAQDILGPRPPILGSCGEGKAFTEKNKKTYANIRPALDQFSDFLIELETSTRPGMARIANPAEEAGQLTMTLMQTERQVVAVETLETGVARYAMRKTQAKSSGGSRSGSISSLTSQASNEGRNTRFNPGDVIPNSSKSAVFCIPPNQELLAYWDRVEDRLLKIRSCRDIEGVRRTLDLFQPEIDPRLLARMKAAGLTLDDVLNSTSGNLPPYRFTYLIDKARQYAGTLQSLGAQLMSAIEKRDGEELAQLRAVHEQNLLKMRTRMTELEIDAAEETLEGLRRLKAAALYRQEHYRTLFTSGLIPSERNQQEHQREAANFKTMAGLAQVVASILTIIPDMGAPTAMKFGGSQIGAAGRAAAEGLSTVGTFNEMAASMAASESSNRRRDEEWKHQIEGARLEILQLDRQIAAAEIRQDIAVRTLEVQEKSVDQAEEVFTYLRDKFSDFGRYTYLSNRLHGLYRVAYNSALSMARMAEQAYRAERPDDPTLLDAAYWDANNAGLLAGERLLNALQDLERRYIETNYRQIEVEQSFSLAQLAPDRLATLRNTGECAFDIPEWFFDLTYPGQYRRRLKAVRISVPCVTGPYVNVGATLRLDRCEIRLNPLVAPTRVPLRHTTAIATSRAQNDAGVFDFNFRDERFMPFEGAGAISSWQLSLPKTLRVFDYSTIADVVIHLSYASNFDGLLKEKLEKEAEGIITQLKQAQSMVRVFSLRCEFPDVFHRIASSPVGTSVGFALEPRHFPFFLSGRTLKVGAARLRVMSPLNNLFGAALQLSEKTVSTSLDVRTSAAPNASVEGRDVQEFDFGSVTKDAQFSGIASALIGDYVIQLTMAGPLAPVPAGNDGAPVDRGKLHDIVLEVRYCLA